MEMRHRKMEKREQKEGSGEQSRKRQKDIDNRRNGDRLFFKNIEEMWILKKKTKSRFLKIQ